MMNEEETKRNVLSCLRESGWADHQIKEQRDVTGRNRKKYDILLEAPYSNFLLAVVETKAEGVDPLAGITNFYGKYHLQGVPVGFLDNGKIIYEVDLVKQTYKEISKYPTQQELFIKYKTYYQERMKRAIFEAETIQDAISIADDFVEMINKLGIDCLENIMLFPFPKQCGKSISENIVAKNRFILIEKIREITLHKGILGNIETEYIYRAERLFWISKCMEALKLFQTVYKQHPNLEYTKLGIVTCLNGLGQFDEARVVADTFLADGLLANNRKRSGLISIFAEEFLFWGQTSIVRYYLNQLSQEEVIQNGLILSLFGRVCSKEYDYDKAIPWFIKSLKIQNSEDVSWELAECYLRCGEYDRANEIYQHDSSHWEAGVNMHIITEIIIRCKEARQKA